ncbi:attachment glycoprotein [Wufeng Rhinolophus pearsonii paramyxovirus 1]|uniref:Attachment glycoprotein n=1 Tax=Wufeng Rhinolophus pearsonii paramyxovirus 1 TaxID=2877502 RepID=A0AAE8XSF0_9MONO|nr:attachment glycoprotein [Wufeng Rhinolophus pearsonii paramyxovirus 1]
MAAGASANYFNQSQTTSKSQNSTKPKVEYIQSWGTTCFSILSFLSLLVLLILNITTLIKTYNNSDNSDKCLEFYKAVSDKVENVYEDISVELKPQLNVISKATSYSLPSMINAAETSIVSEISKACSSAGSAVNSSCPQLPRMFHASQVSLLDRKYTNKCIQDGGSISIPDDLIFENYPSFIPSPTTPHGCASIPSFSLSNSIFSYTQTVDISGCVDTPRSFQTWILGYIGTSPFNTPEPRINKLWDMGNNYPRKSCSTVAGSDYAWMGCTLKYIKDINDYANPGINQVYLAYQDIYGNRREWIYNGESINFDKKYAAFSFAIGSGIIIDGWVYFLAYGGLLDPEPGDVMCRLDNCPGKTQEDCNTYSKIPYYSNRQMVNAVLFFQDNANVRPRITVHTIPPSQNWQGTEGRLYYDEASDKIYIYTKSAGWHSSLQIGFVYRSFPFNITWVDYPTLSRPGGAPCGNDSSCPQQCITGVYTDVFPLTSDLKLVITASLLSKNTNTNPAIISATPDEITGKKIIYDSNQQARYTTTTCFGYEIDIWCLSIMDIAQSNNNDYFPIPFLYKLDVDCNKNDWWSKIRNNQYLNGLFSMAFGSSKTTTPAQTSHGPLAVPPLLNTSSSDP